MGRFNGGFFMKLFSTPPVLSGKKNKKRKKLLKAQRKALKRADHPMG